jgi:HD-like signal output (HDOD) protein
MGLSITIRRLLSTQPVDLPVFHPIAVRLQQLLRNPDFSIEDVVQTIDGDPALASQILKVANSAVYMGRVRVETIHEAVVRLGALQVSNLAMTASQAGLYESDNEVINRNVQKLWLHSHACAVGCRWLAKSSGYPNLADQAYMAGLLHDIGKLYLVKALEKLNRAGVAQAALEDETLLEIFSELHVEQGCRIMQHWNMPVSYVDAVALHHAETYDRENTIVTIVRTVNAACRRKGISLTPNPTLDLMALPEVKHLESGRDEMSELEDILEDSLDLVL